MKVAKPLFERKFTVKIRKPSETEWLIWRSGLSYEAALCWEGECRAHGDLVIIEDETRAVAS